MSENTDLILNSDQNVKSVIYDRTGYLDRAYDKTHFGPKVYENRKKSIFDSDC